jgi:hypothetical protein
VEITQNGEAVKVSIDGDGALMVVDSEGRTTTYASETAVLDAIDTGCNIYR